MRGRGQRAGAHAPVLPRRARVLPAAALMGLAAQGRRPPASAVVSTRTVTTGTPCRSSASASRTTTSRPLRPRRRRPRVSPTRCRPPLQSLPRAGDAPCRSKGGAAGRLEPAGRGPGRHPASQDGGLQEIGNLKANFVVLKSDLETNMPDLSNTVRQNLAETGAMKERGRQLFSGHGGRQGQRRGHDALRPGPAPRAPAPQG